MLFGEGLQLKNYRFEIIKISYTGSKIPSKSLLEVSEASFKMGSETFQTLRSQFLK